MFRKRGFTFFILVMLSTTFAFADNSIKLPKLPNVPGPMQLDGTHSKYITAKDKEVAERSASFSMMKENAVTPLVEVGAEITLDISDSYLERDYEETFVVVADGQHGIMLVEKAAYESFDGEYYHFPNNPDVYNPNEPMYRAEDLISKEQLDYMLKEFDETMYPGNTSVFGEPLPRGDEGLKTWILVHNIRDDSYYVPGETSLIVGYFSSGEDTINDKNMIHIDSYDWGNRVGPDAERPYGYEGTVAHEFQHLIHFDRDADEPSWVDEGCANLAGYINGYGHPEGHIAYYLKYHAVTPLTFWGGGLNDYGASYLFVLYLYEKFGENEFISALVREQANGIEGIENTLKNAGHSISFGKVFKNWTIANFLDLDDSKLFSQYGYKLLDIGEDSYGYTIDSVLDEDLEIPPYQVPFEISSDWAGSHPMPYTAHYYRFNSEKSSIASIDGDDYTGVTAYEGTYEYYSDAQAWAYKGLTRTFDIPESGATLNFQIYYEIEENWDYAYVEVFDHDTNEWYTLAADGLTVNTFPNVQDNPNVDPEREPDAYLAQGRWNAFTGNSDGWVPVTMDLSPFAGHKIDITFRTWQDGAFTYQMAYLDNISIPEIDFFDGAENGNDGWTVSDWELTDGKKANNLNVNTLSLYTLPDFGGRLANQEIPLFVRQMPIDDETESGKIFLLPASEKRGKKRFVSIVSNNTDQHMVNSKYIFKVEQAIK